jgi:nucleoid-associated protein YgaU
MITVENDWVEYQTVPARRPAVRGGGACAQRVPLVRAARPMAPRPVPERAVLARAAAPTRPAPSARPATRSARLRLTRRGRLLLVVLPSVLAATCGLVAVAGPLVPAQADPATSRSVVVGAGDTLWSIAERVAPNSDPRDVVARLEAANGLPDATIQAGARLVLPAEYDGR